MPSQRELFTRRCYLLAITDKATVSRLWQEEKTRRADAEERALREAREARHQPAPKRANRRE